MKLKLGRLILQGSVFLASFLSGLASLQPSDPILAALTEAQQLIIQGNLEEAEVRLLKAAAQYPPDPRLSNFLGVVYAQTGNYAESERSFQEALQMAPEFLGALVNLARLYQEKSTSEPEATAKAIQTYKKALELDPALLEANFQLAVLLQREGGYEESLRYLLRLPDADRRRPQALAIACANFAATGRLDEFEDTVEALVASEGTVEEDIVPILGVLVSHSQINAAISLMESVSSRSTLSIEGTEQLSALYQEAGDYVRARVILEGLTGRHPNMKDLLVRLGWVSYRAGEYENALRYIAHARDLAPLDSRIHIFFGLACVELGLGAEALKSFEQGLSLAPENPFYNFAFATAILHWRDAAEAIPYFEKYCQLRPGDARGYVGLGKAHFLNKEYDKARPEFEKGVESSETAATAFFYLGAIDRLEQRLPEALDYLQRSLELDPENTDAMAELGWIFTRKREFDKAERILQNALDLNQDHYQANFNLLTLYSRTKDSRYEAQKERFQQVKDNRWQEYTDSLRTIQVVPHQVFPDLELEFRRAN